MRENLLLRVASQLSSGIPQIHNGFKMVRILLGNRYMTLPGRFSTA